MPYAQPLAESSLKKLQEIKQFATLVQAVGAKIACQPGEERMMPVVRFVKNYLIHYSTALLDQVIDLQFRNSYSLFQKSRQSLMEDFEKLETTYSSAFEDEQIVVYAKVAVRRTLSEPVEI
ncbi:hypothetical protein CAEBREN_12971 [Caenorhabditis brenneri]|uniref:Uncharacterized protein n=1 Tax=Caenorhabditis brenneri TaxID=135651 RepID=G0M6I5_CAEBE|nr:hypothetical protein CAEBREN_12971 [Caenorhabditis brenneri]